MLYVKMLHSTISTEIITLRSSKMSIIIGPIFCYFLGLLNCCYFLSLSLMYYDNNISESVLHFSRYASTLRW